MSERSRNFEIRRADEGDWAGIWSLLRDIVRAGDTYTWPTDVTDQEAKARWLLADPWQVLVAVTPDGKVLGTAKYGPNQDGPGDHVANASFMVDPRSKGSGVGPGTRRACARIGA